MTETWRHHDGSRRTLPPRHGFTPLEVCAFHATLGEARRQFAGEHADMVEKAISALERFDVWDAETSVIHRIP